MAWQPLFFGNGHSFDQILIPEGVKLMTRWENFSPVPYKDAHKSGFKWAIGFGHVFGADIDPVEINEETMEFYYKQQWRKSLTREEGMEIFAEDIEAKMKWLRKKVQVRTTTFMWNAMGSCLFNVGQGNFEKGPILPLLNKELYMGAANAFHFHNKKWVEQLVDGKPVPDPEKPGKNKMELVVSNGLSVRRSCEVEMFSRYAA